MKYGCQYNGAETIRDILAWCADNILHEHWDYKWDTFEFFDESAYVFFLMRWTE